ncbi:DsbC family protein [Cognatilysobacter lacus]|uniref:Thiol:disulfide interchange protein n=1 Tax=Cognatilysobacter lacus TaxID=1643323 RepID=A0A5D8ZAW0_9GAMM|nr:DsbC family protein [Lysobacter lacus]TZF91252.1 DsbC family protein [Lysobacter lacus]
MRSFRKPVLLAVLGVVSLAACAKVPGDARKPADTPKAGASLARTAGSTVEAKPAAGTPDARAIDAIRVLEPRAVVEHVGNAPLPGFREVVVAGQVAYVSDDGRYLFIPGAGGALYDTVNKNNLTEVSLAGLRTKLLQQIPQSDRIVFAPPNPRHRVTVFTDISCGFCRKFHSEIAEYNRQGIAVEYVAFPRAGIGSDDYRQMVSVWCAPDRRKALTDAKNDRMPPMRTCKNPVDMEYDIGQRAGLTGTPMVIADDGTQLGGYVPPDKLREILDKMEPAKKAG